MVFNLIHVTFQNDLSLDLMIFIFETIIDGIIKNDF